MQRNVNDVRPQHNGWPGVITSERGSARKHLHAKAVYFYDAVKGLASSWMLPPERPLCLHIGYFGLIEIQPHGIFF
jgi:hypothetical protein